MVEQSNYNITTASHFNNCTWHNVTMHPCVTLDLGHVQQGGSHAGSL